MRGKKGYRLCRWHCECECHLSLCEKDAAVFSALEKTCGERRERGQSTGLSQVNKQER